MKIKNIALLMVLLGFSLLILSACSRQEDAAEEKQPKLSPEKLTEAVTQLRGDLDHITKAALAYENEKGSMPTNVRTLNGYLGTTVKPPVEVRDDVYKFEWTYYLSNSLGNLGGPTEERDTVVYLEGVTEQVCFAFNEQGAVQKEMAWDFVGKKQRPDLESWCENGGNPYRIIRVVSLQ